MRLESSWTGFVAALQVMRPDFPSGRRERNTRQCRRGRRAQRETTRALFPRTRSGAGRPSSFSGKLLRSGPLLARIVEVEAYRGASDAASHAFRGKTAAKRHDVRPPGSSVRVFHLRHALLRERRLLAGGRGGSGAPPCASRRCMGSRRWRSDVSGAAGWPRGSRQARRPAPAPPPKGRPWRPEDLCSGPAKLCQAFALDRRADGYDLISGREGVVLLDDGTRPPPEPAVGTRIGLAKTCAARDEPWRWWVAGEPSVSQPRLSGYHLRSRDTR